MPRTVMIGHEPSTTYFSKDVGRLEFVDELRLTFLTSDEASGKDMFFTCHYRSRSLDSQSYLLWFHPTPLKASVGRLEHLIPRGLNGLNPDQRFVRGMDANAGPIGQPYLTHIFDVLSTKGLIKFGIDLQY
mmetsp:Transcript_8762/g.25091  ORF Transcript_8762/g.25091 Transcript_8762/m.25091 type:complete len:131 (+) Transcript_8762:381-773(+)